MSRTYSGKEMSGTEFLAGLYRKGDVVEGEVGEVSRGCILQGLEYHVL